VTGVHGVACVGVVVDFVDTGVVDVVACIVGIDCIVVVVVDVGIWLC